MAGRIGLHRRVVLLAGSVATWVSVVCLGSIAGTLSPWAGLVACCRRIRPLRGGAGGVPAPTHVAPAPLAVVRVAVAAVDEEELELDEAIRPDRGRPVDAVVAVVALVVVVVASVVMERAATTLGARFSIPSIVIGGIVLAAVTSLPNAVAAVYLAAKGRGAAVLSTALNSNSLNVVLGLLLPAVVLGIARADGDLDDHRGVVRGARRCVSLALAFASGGCGAPRAGSPSRSTAPSSPCVVATA